MDVRQVTEVGELTTDELDSITGGFWVWLELPVLAVAAIVALGAGLVAMAHTESWLAAPGLL
jgi:bacteriocin-like protein